MRALVPGVVFAETAHGFVRYVRTDRLDQTDVDAALSAVVSLPLYVIPSRLLARQALSLALMRGLSAYDACYLALALGNDAVLVTADRRLADAADRAALLPHDLPPPADPPRVTRSGNW